MTLDHSVLWSMYASLEELRGKIGHVLECAIQKSKVAWSNVIAKRCRVGCNLEWVAIMRLTCATSPFSRGLFSRGLLTGRCPLSARMMNLRSISKCTYSTLLRQLSKAASPQGTLNFFCLFGWLQLALVLLDQSA